MKAGDIQAEEKETKEVLSVETNHITDPSSNCIVPTAKELTVLNP